MLPAMLPAFFQLPSFMDSVCTVHGPSYQKNDTSGFLATPRRGWGEIGDNIHKKFPQVCVHKSMYV